MTKLPPLLVYGVFSSGDLCLGTVAGVPAGAVTGFGGPLKANGVLLSMRIVI